jgi:hypothetical protein
MSYLGFLKGILMKTYLYYRMEINLTEDYYKWLKLEGLF